MSDKSLIILKPGSFNPSTLFFVIKKILDMDLEIIRMNYFQFVKEDVLRLWPEIYGQFWTEETINYMTQSVSVLILVRGKDAIKKATDIKYDFRNIYSKNEKVRNLIHSSESEIEYQREIKSLDIQ